MNKVATGTAKIFALALSLMVGALMIGCKSATEPASSQAYDSEAAADMNASALGTDAGGAGVNFGDSHTLLQTGDIASIVEGGKINSPQTKTKSFDPITKEHTLVITRNGNKNGFDFTADITYKYTFYDAAGVKMDSLKKGITDKIDISVTKSRSVSKGDRLDATDAASGTWTITAILTGSPILNGGYNRDGSIVFHTVANGDRTMTFSLAVNFVNDTLVKDADGYTHLKGPANSDFKATTPKGYNIERKSDITFNGDGTATLVVTRTSGDGTTETFTIDVKAGKFLRKIR
ncbi:MAG: hypothetical protein WCH46_08235 [bacterium]